MEPGMTFADVLIYLFNRKVTRLIKLSFTQTGNWRDNRKFVNGVKLLLQVLKTAEQEVKDELKKWTTADFCEQSLNAASSEAASRLATDRNMFSSLSSSALVLIHSCSLIGSTVSLLSSTLPLDDAQCKQVEVATPTLSIMNEPARHNWGWHESLTKAWWLTWNLLWIKNDKNRTQTPPTSLMSHFSFDFTHFGTKIPLWQWCRLLKIEKADKA